MTWPWNLLIDYLKALPDVDIESSTWVFSGNEYSSSEMTFKNVSNVSEELHMVTCVSFQDLLYDAVNHTSQDEITKFLDEIISYHMSTFSKLRSIANHLCTLSKHLSFKKDELEVKVDISDALIRLILKAFDLN